MEPKQRVAVRRGRYSRKPTPDLVAIVARSGDSLNVRMMEELLARGRECEPGIVAALNLAVAGAGEVSRPVWLAVVAGEQRSARVVPALLNMLRATRHDDHTGALAAAEALAKIGGPAVDGLAELARDGVWWQRIWAYGSLGWNADAHARQALLAALPDERRLTDAVATALADQGDAAAIPALLEALSGCAPALRPEVESAIRELHAGRRDRPIDQDWRLRYQINPGWGDIHPGWPAVAVMVREEGDGRLRPTPAQAPAPIRSLGEILADPDPAIRATIGGPAAGGDDAPCDRCGGAMWVATGATVCPVTALGTTWIQHRWLAGAEEEALLDDLFDVFDLLYDEYRGLLDGPRPLRRKERARVDSRLHELDLAWLAVHWLIRQGIEDTASGRARLRAEMERLAERFGDPHGVLNRGERAVPN